MTVAIRNDLPSEHEMMVYHTMAEQAVSSKMYKGIGDKAGVMVIMLAARELGIPAMAALNGGLNIIQGKVEISARMMNAMIRKAGHSITIKESTNELCCLVGKRADNGDTFSASFTLAEARLAGLVKPTGGWAKCPKDMCFARALSRLARQLFADVIGIGYVEGEIKAAEVEVKDVNPVYIEEDLRNKYFDMFEPDDVDNALEYLNAAMRHFGWTMNVTIAELLKDPEATRSKFINWRSKQ